MKSIKNEVIATICKSNCVNPNDLVCVLDAQIKIMSTFWFYGFYILSKDIYCFYWTYMKKPIYPDNIVYFTCYATYAKYVNERMRI